MVGQLTLDLLHIFWRQVAIASTASKAQSRASVGLSAMLVARSGSQLFLNTKFNPVVADSIALLLIERPYGAACSGSIAAMVDFFGFGSWASPWRRKFV
jgi:hypothetical protein